MIEWTFTDTMIVIALLLLILNSFYKMRRYSFYKMRKYNEKLKESECKGYKIEILTDWSGLTDLDMTQFKKELIGDLHIVLRNIFTYDFEQYLGMKNEEIFYLDKEANLLRYLFLPIKNENDRIMVNMIFSRISIILFKINHHQRHYYDLWKNNEWTLIKEFKDEWYYNFFREY